jgi:hypothetical protein
MHNSLVRTQMQDKYSKSGIACFLEKDDISWDPSDEEALNNPCWQVRRQVRQLIRKVSGFKGRLNLGGERVFKISPILLMHILLGPRVCK